MQVVKRTFNLQRLKSQICFIYLTEGVSFACGKSEVIFFLLLSSYSKKTPTSKVGNELRPLALSYAPEQQQTGQNSERNRSDQGIFFSDQMW